MIRRKNNARIDLAILRLAWNQGGSIIVSLKVGVLAVEAELPLMLFGAVAPGAIQLQDRFDLFAEVHLLRGKQRGARCNKKESRQDCGVENWFVHFSKNRALLFTLCPSMSIRWTSPCK